VIPSDDVITLLPGPLLDTTTKRDNSGAQHTEVSEFVLAAVRVVHDIPSEDVIIDVVELVLLATATNNDRDGAHVTLFQFQFNAAERIVQVIPFEDVIKLPEYDTATNKDISAAQHIDEYIKSVDEFLVVHVDIARIVSARDVDTSEVNA
jgi:hypothetical protein